MRQLKFAAIGSIGLLITLPIVVMRLTHSVSIVDGLICNNSPLILISSASLVMLFDKIETHSGIVNWLASSTLAIYLLTDNSFRKVIDTWLLDNIKDNALTGYLIVFALCLVCILFDKVKDFLFIPIKKYILK